ncbi:MAG: acyl carrier protein [Betaproteobacteria bacterium]|nr:acyl carrier protein [Betaproteobacteria bacterium]
MQTKVYEIVARIMGVALADVSEDSSPLTLPKWDSLRHMKLILSLEETLNIQFSDADISMMKDVRSILERVSARKP